MDYKKVGINFCNEINSLLEENEIKTFKKFLFGYIKK